MKERISLGSKRVALSAIQVNREARQRQLLDEEIQALAENIGKRGLLNPLIVEPLGDDQFRLIAGERRLEALKILGWTAAPVRFAKDLDDRERVLLEWAENAHRKDLTWQDRARAVCSFHVETAAAHETWTYDQSGEELGISRPVVVKSCLVWKAAKNNPVLLDCTSLAQAYNAIERKFSRSLGVVLADTFNLPDAVPDFTIDDPVTRALTETTDPNAVGSTTDMTAVKILAQPTRAYAPTEKKTHWEVRQSSFADWAESYNGAPFNVIHCDFPYGVQFTNTGIFRKANALDDFYDDRSEDFWQLCTIFRTHWEKLVARDAHIIFWYSMNYYQQVIDFFRSVGDELGLQMYIDPFPLIWFKSDNKGMMHDSKRKPRRVYETALLITVGEQQLCRPGSNVFAGPTAADKHPSAKPLSAVKHFLKMVVDETSRVLDPTCGHGSAISAAIELEARAAYGVELDPTHVARARLEIGQTERRFLEEKEVKF